MDREPMMRSCRTSGHPGPRALPALLLGLGAFLLATGLAAEEDDWQAREEGVTLNFEKADINSVIAMVSERTGRNFVVDPRVRGELTVISHQPVDDEQLYQVFLSALQIHGFTAIPVKGATRIIPKNLAKRDQTPVADEEAPGEGYEFVTRVLEIEHVEANELVPLLRPLVSDEAQLAAYAPTNTLILSESAGNIERVEQLVDRIDRDTTGVTEVVPVEHGSAPDIMPMVQEIEPEERAGRRLVLAADERSNSILIGGDPARRPHVRELIERLDTELGKEEGAAVLYLRYADAESVVPILEGVAKSMSEQRTGATKPTIHAHKSTNALIINGASEVVASLRSVANQLDVRRAQVLVQAIIAEVSADRAQELGIQWGALGDSALGAVNFSAAGNASLAALGRAAETGDIPDNLNADGLTTGAADQDGDIGLLLRALATESDSNILSAPSVMTMDNEEAEIVVGKNVPFVTGRAIEDSGQAFSSIQREDVGIQLTIRPQINEGDAIKLDLEQEVSALDKTPQTAQDLVTTKRSLTTTAMVDDGQTIVLGGLMDEQVRTTTQRVPGLGSLPGLGWLFRYESSQVTKQNLMVFLRPRIVESRAEAREVTAPKYSAIRGRQLATREEGLRFIDDSEIPALAESPELMQLPPAFGNRTGAPPDPEEAGVGAPPRP